VALPEVHLSEMATGGPRRIVKCNVPLGFSCAVYVYATKMSRASRHLNERIREGVHVQRPSVGISGHQRPSEAIRGHQWPSEAIRGHPCHQ